MKIVLPDRTTHTLPRDPVVISDLLHRFGCKPAGVIVLKNGVLVPEDLMAEGDDEIKVIAVSHGG
ncbi:MAG: thiamine S protein [Methanocalculus sp. MSAO_Arc2]|uniref:thiamine S protein n=1 Tax=Methanocalculus sp. MSAO_Arc2 TaxID=2293855 RepID=UPI000FF47A97|nr:MAG: thiamine S protein [Methanocalculus sp. MSAO_Arc2]